uniref:Uncharacterized protein n=1 Tax=Lygus hesperus TaxID=30085 RepID=A0A146M3M9_LYGHE
MTRIGQLKPSALHLQRLRFALALDQPASLISFSKLFAVDSMTSCPSHLYEELLTLTLDVLLQQQCYLMSAVLHACAVRHERYAAEGAEECDGHVPVSFLKKGLVHTLSTLRMKKDMARAFT